MPREKPREKPSRDGWASLFAYDMSDFDTVSRLARKNFDAKGYKCFFSRTTVQPIAQSTKAVRAIGGVAWTVTTLVKPSVTMMRSSGPENKEERLEPDLRASNCDGVSEPRPLHECHGLTNEFQSNNVPIEEIGDGRNVSDSSAAPLVKGGPRNSAAAPMSVALNEDGPPLHRRQIDDSKKAMEGPQLQDGPPCPPRLPEFDDSLTKRVDKEQATSNQAASTAFEDRLRSKVLGEQAPQAAQEARGSSNVGNTTANEMEGPQ
ncbi:hypothetical protein THAOC_07612, partial [Thalassiosira oceanica]